MKRSIVVIGSINMDLVCRTPTLPHGGETILGGEFVTAQGGKGANQAVAAARLVAGGAGGTKVHMVGRVGDDAFGRSLLAGLRENQVGTTHVSVTRNVNSGVAMIVVDRQGENSIVVAPGANARLTPGDIDVAKRLITSASVVVLQLEIPLATVRHAIALCRGAGVFTILDPAPVPPVRLGRDVLGVDLLTPNETEARMLVRRTLPAAATAETLMRRGAGSVVLKLGSRGAVMRDGNGSVQSSGAFRAKVLDTTAAGDAFTGALAVALAEGMDSGRALDFANAAGSVCCRKLGAQPSLPSRAAVRRLWMQRSDRLRS